MKGGFNMKENKTNWWMILGIVIVVAVISSLITANFTGNVIKVNADRMGANKVYTKAEVDAKFNAWETNLEGHLSGKYSNYTQAIFETTLQRMTTRVITSADKNTTYGMMTCQQLCKTTLTNKDGVANDITNQNCMFGIGYENGAVKDLDQDMCSKLISQSLDRYGDQIACVCA
jgi:hypothetical protein